jgi:hypothetical protein
MALLPAAITYASSQDLDYYDAFVMFLDATSLHLSRLRASKRYMQDLFNRKHPNEDVLFQRSKSYDFLNGNSRKEIVRLIMGLFRYLSKGKQCTIPCNYGDAFR